MEKVPTWSVTGSRWGGIPGAVVLKVKGGMKVEGILVGSAAEGDVELGAEARKGTPRGDGTMPTPIISDGKPATLTVATTVLVAVSITERVPEA